MSSPKEIIAKVLWDVAAPWYSDIIETAPDQASRDALAILSALEREGWKVVDREPTKPMMESGYQIDGSYG